MSKAFSIREHGNDMAKTLAIAERAEQLARKLRIEESASSTRSSAVQESRKTPVARVPALKN